MIESAHRAVLSMGRQTSQSANRTRTNRGKEYAPPFDEPAYERVENDMEYHMIHFHFHMRHVLPGEFPCARMMAGTVLRSRTVPLLLLEWRSPSFINLRIIKYLTIYAIHLSPVALRRRDRDESLVCRPILRTRLVLLQYLRRYIHLTLNIDPSRCGIQPNEISD